MIGKALRIGLLLLLGALLLFATFILTTQGGLRLSVAYIQHRLPGKLTIQSLTGNWLDGLQIKHLRYQDQQHFIHIQTLQSHWHLLTLLTGQLRVQALAIKNLDVKLKAKSTSSKQHVSFPIKISFDQIHLDNIKLSAPHSFGQIQLKQAQLSTQHHNKQWFITGAWHALRWQPDLKRQLYFPKGHITLIGTQKQYHLVGGAHFIGKHLPSGDLYLQAIGRKQQLQIKQLSGHFMQGTLTLSGLLNWQKRFAWQLTLSGQRLNLIDFNPKWPSDINFTLHSQGDLAQAKIALQLNQLTGHFQQNPIAGQGEITWQPQHWNFKQVNLSLRNAKLQINGFINQKLGLTWQLHIPQLNRLFNQAQGRIDFQGHANGSLSQPIINSQLFMQGINTPQYKFKQLSAKLLLNEHGKQHINLQILGKQIATPQQAWQTLQITANGLIEKQRIHLLASNAQTKAQLTLTGGWSKHYWQGNMTQLSLYNRYVGNWQLQTQQGLMVNQQAVRIEPVCLSQKQQQICVKLHWKAPHYWQADLQTKQLKLANFNHWLPKKLEIFTTLNSHIHAENTLKHQNMQMQFNLTAGKVSYQVQNQRRGFNFNQITSTATYKKQQFDGKLAISAPNKQHLNLQWAISKVHLPINWQQSMPLQATLQANISDLEFLPVFIPGLTDLHGQLTSDLRILGSVQHPRINGQLHTQVKNLTLSHFNLHISQANFGFNSHFANKLRYQGKIQAQGKTLVLRGNSNNKLSAFKGHFSLAGDDFPIMQTDEYQINVSPNLQARINHQQLHITGLVLIPQAKLHPDLHKKSSIRLPDDVVFVSKRSMSPYHKLFSIHNNIKIKLGDEVALNFEGLMGKLRGEVTLNSTPNQPTLATGELHVKDGAYRAYGQSLTIRHGRLIFTGGPLNNPGVNIQAVRKITITANTTGSNTLQRLPTLGNISRAEFHLPSQNDQITAGIAIAGTIKHPRITLFSEPTSYSQANILALLVFGHPMDQGNTAGSRNLLQAAQALNLSNTDVNKINNELQHAFGLDQFSIESTAVPTTYLAPPNRPQSFTQNTSLVVGKQLGNRLFVNYSIGLLEPINILKIRYLLTRHFSIQSQSSTSGNGVDLFYTIEK